MYFGLMQFNLIMKILHLKSTPKVNCKAQLESVVNLYGKTEIESESTNQKLLYK